MSINPDKEDDDVGTDNGCNGGNDADDVGDDRNAEADGDDAVLVLMTC